MEKLSLESLNLSVYRTHSRPQMTDPFSLAFGTHLAFSLFTLALALALASLTFALASIALASLALALALVLVVPRPEDLFILSGNILRLRIAAQAVEDIFLQLEGDLQLGPLERSARPNLAWNLVM